MQIIDAASWCGDDRVSFERAAREGPCAVISNDVHELLGRGPRSFRSFAMEHGAMLRAV